MRGEDPVRDWSLVMEKVTLEDDGIFQCQVGWMSKRDRIDIENITSLILKISQASCIIMIIVSLVTKSFNIKVGSGSESKAIRSALAKLTVLVPPGQPKIVHQGSGEEEGRTELEVEVEEGAALELTCVSEGGRPAGEITWRDEEGEQVRRSSFFQVDYFSKILFTLCMSAGTDRHRHEHPQDG